MLSDNLLEGLKEIMIIIIFFNYDLCASIILKMLIIFMYEYKMGDFK